MIKFLENATKGVGLLTLSIAMMYCGKKTSPTTTVIDPPKPPVKEVVDSNKYVALFYFANWGESMYTPDCLSPSGDAWIMQGQTPAYSPYGISNFWGKPNWAATHGDGTIKNNYRFYYDHDPTKTNDSLLDYHADLITQAGVDFIVLDFTNGAADFSNGPSYISATKALCNRYTQRLAQGKSVPKIAFFVHNEPTLQDVENTFFKVYDSTLFFNFLGKKLVLVADPDNTGDPGNVSQPPIPTKGLFGKYTTRHCWALNNDGNCWQFKENAETPPPAFYYKGKPEQMSAAISCGGTSDGVNLLPGSQGRQNGEFFKKYVDAAIKTKVQFLFVHSWNEWSAGNWSKTNTQVQPLFIDQWLTEYSSDIEPMYGGHGDKYYTLMKEQIALFRK